MSQHLTDKIVEALPRPASGNCIAYDGGDKAVRGFGVRVTSAGARSFIFNYRAGGRERRITIGSWPAWKVKVAREEAGNLRRRVDRGEDPMAERQADRAAPTIETLAERYLAEHARPRKRSVKDDESLLRQLIIPKLGRLRVGGLRRSEIEAFHRQISATTPVRANRSMALLSKMFALAIKWEIRDDNPCKGIERNPEERRDRYLSPEELGRLVAALADHPQQARANIIRLLLLTGARRGEVAGATWNQFDLDRGIWTKPAAMTKQKKLHRIPISAPARQLLSEMKARAVTSDLLFPEQQNADLKWFWASLCKAAGIEGVRMHDLRHSYASYLASAGLSLPVIGALLGHTQPSTTQRYAHLLDDPLRRATEHVGAMVAGAGKAVAEVVRIPSHRTSRS